MKKIGIIELNTTNIKLTFADIMDNQTFVVTEQIEEMVKCAGDLINGELLKPATIQGVNYILKSFKALCVASQITEIYAYASNEYADAKNQKSFFEELYSQSGFRFKILSPEEQVNSLYIAFINSLDAPKGLIISINGTNTQIMAYNRRNILNQCNISYGSVSFAEMFGDKNLTTKEFMASVVKTFNNKLKSINWFDGLDAETQIVGTGDVFVGVARLNKKIKHYPYDKDHAYTLTKEDFDKVYTFVNGLEIDKSKKLKGISNERADVLASGIAILKAIFDASGIKNMVVSKNGITEGALFGTANPLTLEKPLTDVLGNSLETLNNYYNKANIQNTKNVYELSIILFKQLKVLHKLPRTFVKVLRIASYLHDSGKRISTLDYKKKGFNVVLNSDVYGVSHREQILASFVVAIQNLEDFNMTEWVKYKELFTEEDLEGVRRLAVIVRLASALDKFNSGKVKDISCDILGDSVIMKTIVESPAELEIIEGLKVSGDFAKAFKKHLEIL